jgi:predicted metalloprotease
LSRRNPLFRNRARLDTSQIEDHRGRRVGATAGALGGGLGIILLLAGLLLGVDPTQLGAGDGTSIFGELQDQTIGAGPEGEALSEVCQTGEDANEREDCRIVAFVNSVQQFWTDEFVRRGLTYLQATTRFFSGSTQTGCGFASSASGPFYCPPDQQVYIDLSFFEELESRFGAGAAPLAQGYVVAHEYGHHIQNLAGILAQIGNDRQGEESMGVRSELQADCLAGVWASNASATGFLVPLTEADIEEALDAAAAVGDDRIQSATQGRVAPETWTHGSSAQRQEWFLTGYREADMDACDTFSGPI